jgi:hypothetical protein
MVRVIGRAGRCPPVPAAPEAAGSASIGITAMSWLSKTENDALPAIGAHQALFLQGLQHDRG